MIKILHILDPDKVLDNSARPNMDNMMRIIAEMPDIKDYVEYQHKFQYDILLNTGRVVNQWITYREFQDNYLDFESKIRVTGFTPQTRKTIDVVTID